MESWARCDGESATDVTVGQWSHGQDVTVGQWSHGQDVMVSQWGSCLHSGTTPNSSQLGL